VCVISEVELDECESHLEKIISVCGISEEECKCLCALWRRL
jgi:hypothetical protein